MAETTIISKPIDVAERVRAELSPLTGVSEVRVKQRRPDEFEVRIYLSNFEPNTRRSVYAQERAIYAHFPAVSFDFLLVDASEKTSDNGDGVQG